MDFEKIKIVKNLKKDGLVLGAINTIIYLKCMLRSWIAQKSLNAPGITIKRPCTIKGKKYIKFGKNIYINGKIWIEAINHYNNQYFIPNIIIGNEVAFSEDVHISCIDKVQIGDNVLIGSRVYIGDHGHGIYKGQNQTNPSTPPKLRELGGGGQIKIDENVWIGDNVVIIGSVHIGYGAIIGANSVVLENIPEKTIAAGIPAKIIKRFDSHSEKWIGL